MVFLLFWCHTAGSWSWTWCRRDLRLIYSGFLSFQVQKDYIYVDFFPSLIFTYLLYVVVNCSMQHGLIDSLLNDETKARHKLLILG